MIRTSTVNISNCTFLNNRAEIASGGAIYQNQSVSGNTSINDTNIGGGAIYYLNNTSSTSSITNSTFSANSSYEGAALYIANTVFDMLNSTITANTAIVNTGRIIFISSSSVTSLINNTVVRNDAVPDISIIFIESGASLRIANNIIALNGATATDIENTSGTVQDFGSNNFNSVSSITGFVPDASDIYGDPQLDPLGNYGGPTETMPPQLTSPVIDAGNVGIAEFVGLTTDQRGFSRFCGSGLDKTIDIGSVQVGTCGICYVGSTRILTRNIKSNHIEFLPVEKIYSGIYEVFDTDNQKWTVVKANILTEPQSEFILIKKDAIAKDQPMNDLYITGGHPIKINGVEIESQHLSQGIKVVLDRTKIYSLATEECVAILIEGLNILTWRYEEWVNYARDNVWRWSDNKIN